MRSFIVAIVGLVLVAVSAASLAAAIAPTFSLEMPLQGSEILSPADRIDSNQIIQLREGLLVRGLTGVRLVNLADTNSMDPVLDAEATAIEIVPKSASELYAGDIISYQSDGNLIIHRIVAIGDDEEGWYAITKGDNNPVADLGKVRFWQIKGVVVGILY